MDESEITKLLDRIDNTELETEMPDDDELLRRADASDDEFIDSEDLHEAVAYRIAHKK